MPPNGPKSITTFIMEREWSVAALIGCVRERERASDDHKGE